MDYKFSKHGKLLGRTDEYNLVRRNYFDYWIDLKMALTSIGLDYKLFATHDFRRCFADDVYSANKNLLEVQTLLGHQSCDTTARYISSSGLLSKQTLNTYQQKL